MYLIFSGEGSTDTGTVEFPGPMLYLIDQIIEHDKRFSYSILDAQSYEFISRKQLDERVKRLRPLPKERDDNNIGLRSKKRFKETGYFYANARILATIALERKSERADLVIAVLFQDSDTTDQQKWQQKWDSIINGFNAANFSHGVPMLPKPTSEAWILCAIYRSENPNGNCNDLENRKHGDRTNHVLKYELEQKLDAHPTRELLNEKILSGEINHNNINLPSFNQFKERLNEVLIS
ncbi:MAG: hypothetical protein LBT09_00930 [Planctomycetaceae bacterium]|jgi:hypothetical protein|nr:hypothetical protein [Planctomycetaceae bacterium]